MTVIKSRKAIKAGKNVERAPVKAKGKNGECNDKKCPFHASVSLRGRSFSGEVTRKREKTVKVEWPRYKYFHKYERYAKLKEGVSAHLPECLSKDINMGDRVKITECRPLSKTKHFVVVGHEGK